MKSDKEPTLSVLVGENNFVVRRSNASLFTFMGEAAIYDHVFLDISELSENGENQGTYVFRQSDSFSSLAKFLVKNDFPLHANMQAVSDTDRNVWEKYYLSDVRGTDSFPEEWGKEPTEPSPTNNG